jgi:hypothetical protein
MKVQRLNDGTLKSISKYLSYKGKVKEQKYYTEFLYQSNRGGDDFVFTIKVNNEKDNNQLPLVKFQFGNVFGSIIETEIANVNYEHIELKTLCSFIRKQLDITADLCGIERLRK